MKILEAKEIISNAKVFFIDNEIEIANISSYVMKKDALLFIFSLLATFILMLLVF